ncbi:MAG: choice-of-anchor D domain-containing protein [Chlorobiota bacterium]|nr:choice-of-anchor D domain-containing protein [Chlorobiota bacterium]
MKRIAIALLCAIPLWAQTPKKYVLIEEFTSATCPPCVAASEALNQIVNPAAGIISVRYHMYWPQPTNDPFYLANPTDNGARRQYYGVTGIPDAYVMGTQNVDPRSANFRTVLQQELQRPVRLAISIEENRQNAPTIAITVRVRNVSGQAMNLAGHVLHVVVLNRKVEIPDLPRRIPNSNGETVFYDAMMKMLPSASGTALSGSLAPGQEQSFQFTYQLGTGELWPAGQDYVTAFVQNTSTREVIDAGTNLEQRLTLVRVQLAAPSPQFAQVPRSQQITRTLTLRNLNDRPYSFRLLVDASASLVPQGWSVSIAPDSVEIPAGQSQQFTLRVSTSAQAEYAHLVIKPQLLSTQSGAILELRDTTVLVGLLSENTRYVAYWGANSWFSSVYWQPGKQLPAIGQDFAPLPLLPEVMEAFPMRQFQLAILPMGTVPLRAADGSLDYIWNDLQQALQAGTRVYIAANAGLYWAFDPNSTNRLPDVQSFFRSTLGIQYTRLQQRFTQSGGNVYLSSFPISGVAGDSIGDGITATANTSTSFYNLYTDIFATTAGSPARAVFYYDNTPSALGGVRVILPSGARVVYTSFGPEAIASGQLRLQILDRIVTWLLGSGGQQAQPRIALSAYSIRFDTTQVGQRSVQTLTISNTGEGTLRIQQIELQGQDASAFNVPDRDVVPIVLDPGQETQLDIEFRPTREGFHSAQMVLRSNDPQEPESIVLLSGVGTVGVDEPVALGIRLLPNPAAEAAALLLPEGHPGAVVELRDLSGRLLQQWRSPAGMQRVELSLGDCAAGVYSVHVRIGQQWVRLPLVVVR